MAHFALVLNGLVADVVVISNEDIIDADGNESEALGVSLCEQLAGEGQWVQTSYHGSFRRRYAGYQPGMTYDAVQDVFILPSPFPSWVLDLSDPNDWAAPIPQPDEPCQNGIWTWSEDEGNWQCIPLAEQP